MKAFLKSLKNTNEKIVKKNYLIQKIKMLEEEVYIIKILSKEN